MMKKLFYGFGGLSYSVISQTISSFFMFFATSVLDLSGSLVGVVAGTVTLTAIPEILRFASEYRMVTYGVVLIPKTIPTVMRQADILQTLKV